MNTLLGYHDIFLEHNTGPHPECSERLKSIMTVLRENGTLGSLKPVSADVEAEEWILLNHSQEYYDRFRSACNNKEKYIDSPDSAISEKSYEAAMKAVSTTLSACDMIMTGEADNGFCALRPPGHHAEHGKSMGFCMFNNVAIAARYLKKRYKLNRVLILDWDVHHGNGTQHSFASDSSVFFCSIHQHPATMYPGTGWPAEQGKGIGRGFTLNLPLNPEVGDSECLDVFRTNFLPAAEDFKPEFILISAGYDGHIDDEMSQLNLTENSYNQMTIKLKELANKFSQGRILSLLEGGYDLQSLSNCVREHVKLLCQ